MDGFYIRKEMKKIIVSLVILFLFCCSTTYNKATEQFKKTYPMIYLENLEYKNEIDLKSVIQYKLSNTDSSEVLFFAYINKNFEDKKAGDVVFLSFEKRQKINHSLYHISGFNENLDTLYSFKHYSKEYLPNDEAIFLSGKYYYYYQYRISTLNDNQRRFYEENKDSIINNQVNEIPQFEN